MPGRDKSSDGETPVAALKNCMCGTSACDCAMQATPPLLVADIEQRPTVKASALQPQAAIKALRGTLNWHGDLDVMRTDE
jgi:hypothetical protein